jgi:hypothetical protein
MLHFFIQSKQAQFEELSKNISPLQPSKYSTGKNIIPFILKYYFSSSQKSNQWKAGGAPAAKVA